MAAESNPKVPVEGSRARVPVQLDRGDDFVRRLVSSTVLTARTSRVCSVCGGLIRIGRLYERNVVMLWDGPDHPVAFARHIPTCPLSEESQP